MAWTSDLRSSVGTPAKASDIVKLIDNFDYQKTRFQRKIATYFLQDVAGYSNVPSGEKRVLSFATSYDEAGFVNGAHAGAFTIPSGCSYACFSFFYNMSESHVIDIYVRKNGTDIVAGFPDKKTGQMKADSIEGSFHAVTPGDYYELVFANAEAGTVTYAFSFYWFQIDGVFA